MAEKTFKGAPDSYVVDLTHKTLGRYDAKGEFKTSDPDTILRLERMEAHHKSLEKKPLGEQLREKAEKEKYQQYVEIAEVMCDIFEKRGLLKKGSK